MQQLRARDCAGLFLVVVLFSGILSGCVDTPNNRLGSAPASDAWQSKALLSIDYLSHRGYEPGGL